MFGNKDGVVFSALKDVFKVAESQAIEISLSGFQIYSKSIFDLLSQDVKS